MSEWAKKLKMFVFYMNAYQRVTSAENFNQVDRMTWSVDTRDGCHAGAPQHALPRAKADVLTATAEYSICQQQIPTPSP